MRLEIMTVEEYRDDTDKVRWLWQLRQNHSNRVRDDDQSFWKTKTNPTETCRQKGKSWNTNAIIDNHIDARLVIFLNALHFSGHHMHVFWEDDR